MRKADLGIDRILWPESKTRVSAAGRGGALRPLPSCLAAFSRALSRSYMPMRYPSTSPLSTASPHGLMDYFSFSLPPPSYRRRLLCFLFVCSVLCCHQFLFLGSGVLGSALRRVNLFEMMRILSNTINLTHLSPLLTDQLIYLHSH